MGVTAAIIGAIGSIAGSAIGGALSGGGGGGGGGGGAPTVNLQGVSLADPNAAGLGAFINQQGMWGPLSQFTNQINQTATQQYTSLLNQLYPGATSQLGQISSLANQYLSGVLPADVQQQISRASAQQAMAGGYPATGMATSGQLRNLGLTSMEGQQLGANLYGMGLGAAKGMIPGFMNPASLLFSPSQLLARTDQANYYNTDVQNQQQIINAQLQEQMNLANLAASAAQSSQNTNLLSSLFGGGGGGGGLGSLFGGGGGGGGLSSLFGGGGGTSLTTDASGAVVGSSSGFGSGFGGLIAAGG